MMDLPAGPVNLPLYRAGGAERANRDRMMLAHLEERFSPVVAVVPTLEKPVALSLLSADRPVLLVAMANHVTRSQLAEAVETVERFGGTVAGVVLCPIRSGRRG
jgi:hypothetical protein